MTDDDGYNPDFKHPPEMEIRWTLVELQKTLKSLDRAHQLIESASADLADGIKDMISKLDDKGVSNG